MTNGTDTAVFVLISNSTTNVTIEVNEITYNMIDAGNDTFNNQTFFVYMFNETFNNEFGMVTFLPSGDQYFVAIGPISDIDIAVDNWNNVEVNQEQSWIINLGGWVQDTQWVWYGLGIVCVALLIVIGIISLTKDSERNNHRLRMH